MTAREPQRRALLIGIDSYPLFPPENQLRGCRNDVELMAEVLEEHFGFSDVRRLNDGEASREGIRAALEALRRDTDEGDVVVLHYSGHGSRRRNPEGSSADGFDETLVPHDSGRGDHPNRDVADVEIARWLREINRKTPYVTLIFDACHAGSLTRDSLAARTRSVPADIRPAESALSAPVDYRAVGSSRRPPQNQCLVTFAACRSHQRACELKRGEASRPQGALTYYLCRELLRARPGESCRDIFERFAPRLTAAYPDQHPQLEGAWDRALFGCRDFRPMLHVPVRQRREHRVVLAAGAAHGLCGGSEWILYPPGTRETEKESAGRIRLVDAVDALNAEAIVLEERSAGAITAGCRAVETAPGINGMTWKVSMHCESARRRRRRALETAVADSRFLEAVPVDAPADVYLHHLERREVVRQGDPAPGAGPVDQPSWVVVASSGEPLFPPRWATEPIAPLISDLERCVRWSHTLSIDNPACAPALRAGLDLELLRRTLRGAWKTAEPEPGGETVYQEGELMAVRVHNRTPSPLYVSLLDFGLGFGITQLYPIRGYWEPLGPGRSLEVGTVPSDEIETYRPDGTPGTRRSFHLKLFATTDEADFSSLEQSGTTVRDDAHPLVHLLRRALAGDVVRDVRRIGRDDWVTLTRRLTLRAADE